MTVKRTLATSAVLLLAALPAIAYAAPKAGKWTAIAPAIDGPNAKHHTKIPFTVKGNEVRGFGVCGKKGACALAGGEACSVAGCYSCSALFELRGPVRIHGSSFSATLKLPGGEVIFKGTFAGSSATGTWEETGPCPTGLIKWKAKAGNRAPGG
jgi:hypothetical protein